MKNDYQDSEVIEKIIENSKIIAVVGLSDKPERPSYGVARYLQSKGFKIIPVNPSIKNVLGEISYPDLNSIPGKVDLVDIFRKSEDVGPIVDAAIAKKADSIWMQEGVVNEEAALKAKTGGLDVVMDLCILKEHSRRKR